MQSSLTSRFQAFCTTARVSETDPELCACVNVWDAHVSTALLACVPACQALPAVWPAANLAVHMGCKFSLLNYGMQVLAPFFKKRFLIYIVTC